MSMFSQLQSRLAGRQSDQESEVDEAAEAADAAESRSELLFRIQELTERNERLTLRFRDVVGAYKTTLKEKEALESSVAALAGGAATGSGDDSGAVEDGASTNCDDQTGNNADGDAEAGSDGVTTKLRAQLDALGRAMATLTKEKSTMESRFQADKKVVADAHRAELEQLRSEHRARVAALEGTVAELRDDRDLKTEAVEQLTEQLRTGHEADRSRAKERDRERKQHMKELEDARKQRDDTGSTSARVLDLEVRLQKAQDAELEALTQLSNGTAELKETISSLEDQLDAANKKLVSAGTRGDGKQVLELKREVAVLEKRAADWKQQADDAKAKLADAVKTAQAQIAAAASKVSQCMSTTDEQNQEVLQQRVLQENQIGELSAMVGKYEAARVEDSARIAELQIECDELRDALREMESAGSHNPDTAASTQPLADRRVQALEKTVGKLQELLRTANQQLAEAEALSRDDDDNQVPQGGAMDELYSYKQSERELRAELTRTLHERDAAVDAVRQQWQAKLTAEQAATRERLEALEASHAKALDDMKSKSTRARERSLQLIDDRNDEVRRLRKLLGATAPPDSLTPRLVDGAPAVGLDGASGAESDGSTANGAPADADGILLDVPRQRASGTSVHAALEMREKSKEMASMRREIRELQGAVLDANEKATLLDEMSGKLKEEIRRLERNKKREGANLEYLKNVLVKFMCKEIGQEQMLLAIATILQFSPSELSDVRKKLSAQSRNWFGT